MHPAVAAYPIALSVVAAGLLPRSDILGVESVREWRVPQTGDNGRVLKRHLPLEAWVLLPCLESMA